MADELPDFPGLFGSDMFTTWASNVSSTDQPPVTIGTFQELLKKFPPRKPEVILLLEQHRAEIRRLCERPELPQAFPILTLYGIECEFFDTIEQLKAAASEHEKAGRNVYRIDE